MFQHAPQKPEPKERRPVNLEEKRALVKKIYAANKWSKEEHRDNVKMLNLPLKAIVEYSDTELDVMLADFEKFSMIIFED